MAEESSQVTAAVRKSRNIVIFRTGPASAGEFSSMKLEQIFTNFIARPELAQTLASIRPSKLPFMIPD